MPRAAAGTARGRSGNATRTDGSLLASLFGVAQGQGDPGLEYGFETRVGHRCLSQGAFHRLAALRIVRARHEFDVDDLAARDLLEPHLAAHEFRRKAGVPVVTCGG